ncbi:MAG: PPC domain-containing DNA-binding protein [Leptolyngbyaceae cyanobacterium bins.349]|nr:PPC domain-containing DNA-binding protein [Leptolyngbyaceae cyanobacterium bins.349]
MNIYALRLRPDQDLRGALKEFAIAHQLQAAFVLTAIGSFKQVALRFADQPTHCILTGRYELLSLNGTLSVHGMHLHMAIADSQGKTLGGHVTEGCLIYTTAEIVLGASQELIFLRHPDAQTGFWELAIQPQES